MPLSRTQAVLEVLKRGRDADAKVAQTILRMFGASSLDECLATYDAIGKAERASLDEAIERVVANAGAAFQLSVDNKMV